MDHSCTLPSNNIRSTAVHLQEQDEPDNKERGDGKDGGPLATEDR